MSEETVNRVFKQLDGELCQQITERSNGIIVGPHGGGLYEYLDIFPKLGVYWYIDLESFRYFRDLRGKINAFYESNPDLIQAKSESRWDEFAREEPNFLYNDVLGFRIAASAETNEELSQEEQIAVMRMFEEKYPKHRGMANSLRKQFDPNRIRGLSQFCVDEVAKQ